MEKDERLKNSSDYEKEIIDNQYKSLFAKNPFSRNETLIIWLGGQLKEHISRGGNDDQIRFEDLSFTPEMSTALKEGNSFYTELFDQDDWVPEGATDKRSKTPFSDAIERLYNNLWHLPNDETRNELTIYSELEHYIEAELGKYVAKESSLNNLEGWNSIQYTTDGLWDFYKSWTVSIDKSIILSLEHDLIDIEPDTPLHELVSLMERRHDKEAASSNYAAKLVKLKDESHWVYVRESTSDSDYITLHDHHGLRGELLLRIGLEPWLKWVDGLQLPIVQDHTFFFTRRVDWLEQSISLIVNEEVSLKTSREHLLLIALKNYGNLIINISDNLSHLKEGEWNYRENEEAQNIIDKAQQQYKDWVGHELKDSCNQIFNAIFGLEPISESRYFKGVFEWINSLSKENYSGKQKPKPSLDCLTILNEEFQQKLNLDTANKVTIAHCLPMKKMSWQVFEKLVRILEHDKSDAAFRQVLYDTYLSYLKSNHFRWKMSFEDLFINQACSFSYVIQQLTNPLNTWASVFVNFRYLHEGWLASADSGHEAKSKEAFVLMAGACLSYSYYKEGDSINGQSVFAQVLGNTITQYRNDFSISKIGYQIVLQLLAHTLGKFDYSKADAFAQSIVDKIDSEEAFLVILHTLTVELSSHSRSLSSAIKTNIEQRTNIRFWILEERYKKGIDSKAKLKYYSELQDAILAN
ncbi:MAG: hypothetical protein AAF632_20570 [Bacteroidota bacterium]